MKTGLKKKKTKKKDKHPLLIEISLNHVRKEIKTIERENKKKISALEKGVCYPALRQGREK